MSLTKGTLYYYIESSKMHLITNLSDIFLDSKFINGSIFQVLKLHFFRIRNFLGFMMTQFFQVLKQLRRKTSAGCSFMMTQFFQVLKPAGAIAL